MSWNVEYLPEAEKDLKKLDHSVRVRVLKVISRVSERPYAKEVGGYGTPLGAKQGVNLTNCYKIKLKKDGIRVVYQLKETEQGMLIIVIGVREDSQVYKMAAHRLNKK